MKNGIKNDTFKWSAVIAGWIGALYLGFFVREGEGWNPTVPNYLVSDRGQRRNSIGSDRFDPTPNGYLEKSGEGKQEGCAKKGDGWPPNPDCTSWLKGQKRRSAPPVGTAKFNAIFFPLPLLFKVTTLVF